MILGWYFCYKSGVHATISGVAFGFLTRVRLDSGERKSPADTLIHIIHPISAGIAIPVFALFAAGIDLRATGIIEPLQSPIAIGIMIGLVVGKPIGIVGMAWIMARFTRATLSPGITWRDVTAVGILGGVGFTVALLISELGYADNALYLENAKIAVLVGSLIAATIAAFTLLSRGRAYARMAAMEEAEQDPDATENVNLQGEDNSRPDSR